MSYDVIVATEFVDKVLPIIDNATKSLDICVFDWRWYPNDVGSPAAKFNQAIIRAAKAGVKIRAIVNSDLLAFQLRSVGVETKTHRSKHLLHLKMMIVDEQIVITGSHNYTQSAFAANYELSVILREVEQQSKFQSYFNTLWS